MGIYVSKHITHPDTTPDPNTQPTFDPLYGFPNGRKPRVMVATEQEMMAARLPPEKRDYCAHKYLDFLSCKNKHFPLLYKCHVEKHNHEQCEYEDYVLRLKEFERERRLLERQKRKQQQQAAAA